jgi:hypothetical protein
MSAPRIDIGESSLVPKEDFTYSKLVFYGVHTHNFIDYEKQIRKSPMMFSPGGQAEAACQNETEGQAGADAR